MDYDVVILGGGLVGCATACALSKYNLNIAVLERNFDIAEEVATYITNFVTDGTDIEDEDDFNLLEGSLDKLEDLSHKGNFYFEKRPSISAFEDEGEFNKFLDRAKKRNIKGVYELKEEEVHKLSPHFKERDLKYIYHENTGIISPYDLATSYGEIASENGVRFKLEEEIIKLERVSKDEVKVITKKSKYSARLVIITAFNDLYLGHETKKKASKDKPLETMLLEKNFKNDIKTMLNYYKKSGLVTSILPSFTNTTVATVDSLEKSDYKQVKKEIEFLIGPFPSDRVDLLTTNSFYEEKVKMSNELEEKGYINIEAKNHNISAMLPKLTDKICDIVVNHFDCEENSDYVYRRRDYFKFKDMSDEERNEAIKFDKRFGKIVCKCSLVTEGEIVNAIRRPLGARTIEGVRRRTGIVFGSCQGSYCLSRVLKILAKELDKKPEEILNDRANTIVLPSRIKEFDSV